MKPVEIEFLTKDKASDGIDDIGKAAVSMGDKVTKASDDLQSKIDEQRAVIKLVEGDLKKLESQLQNMAPGSQWLEMKSEVEACNRVLQEEKDRLADLQTKKDQTTEKAQRLSRQYRDLTEQMALMRLEGKEHTKEYQEISDKAALLADTLGDVRTQTNILAHDNAGLQGIISGASGAAGSVTALTGVMGLFAGQNEDLIKIQTRVQSVMAISMGLQQAMNALNKDSAFRIVTLTKVKNAFAAANTRLAVALGISNVMAKALMATLTLGLSVAIGAVIYLWDQFSSKQSKAKKEFEDFTQKVSQSSGSIVTDFKKMVTEWEKLGDSLEDKKKYIDDNQEAFNKLGVKINEVADAENLLIDNKDAFIESIMLKARAAAAMEMATEKYKTAIEKQLEADKMSDTVTRYASYGMYGGGASYTYEVENSKKKKTQKKADDATAEADSYILASLSFSQDATAKLAEAGIKSTEEIIEGSVAALEKVIADKKKTLKDLTDPKDYQKALKEIEAEQKKLDALTGDDKKKNKPKEEKVKNNLSELELKAMQKIEDQTLALREEGYQKQRDQAKLAYEREKQLIDKEEKDRLALYEKLKAAGENVSEDDRQKAIAQAAALRVQAGALYDKALNDLDKKEQQEQKEKVEKLLEPYKDYAERRLDIEKKFKKDIEEMEKNRTSENSDLIDRSIEQAKKNRTKEYEDLDQEISDAAQRSSKMLEAIFTDAARQSKSQIESVITDAEELLKVLTSGGDGESLGFSPEQIKAMQKDSALIQDLIQKIIDKKNELYDRGGTVSQFIGSFKQIKDALSLDDPEKKMDALGKGIENMLGSGQALVGVFGGLADNLVSIAELSGNDGLAAVAGTMQGIADTMGSAMEGAQAGMAIGGPWGAAIGAVVGGAMSIMSMAGEANARHKAALKEIEEAKLAYQRKYNLLLLEQKLLMEEASNIFGERQIAKAANALEVYKEALEAYKQELQGDKPKMSFTEWITQDAGGTYAKKMQDYEKGIGALSSAQIVTGHKKTGLFGWGKGKDLYSGILDVYPKLIDETGRLDTAMAESILSTHKMDDETKNLIQSLIDLQDQADAAQEQLRDYLKETFGGLGDGIMDSITNAIITGGNDAWENFGKTGANELEKLGKQIAYSLFFAGRFDKLQEQLESIYGSGKSEEQIANESMKLLGNFYNGIGSQMDAAQGFLEDWKRKASEYGFDLWANDEDTTTQTGRASAISTITQDQANSIDGRLTMMQVHEASIDNKMDDIGNGIYQITDRLDQIVENTGSCDKRLEKIENCVEEIKRDGLKVK